MLLIGRRNYGVLLLEAGLARLMQPMADRSANAAELKAAEDAAKKVSLKVWENYNAEEEAAARAAAEALAAVELEPIADEDKQLVEIEITEILDGAHFYAQVAGDTAVAALQEKLRVLCKGPSSGLPFEPKAGMTACAKFSQDDEWYRAKIVSRSGGDYTVFFIDYGNTDVVKADRLKPLDPTLGPKEMSPQALECKLAYLVALPSTDGADGEAAAAALWNEAGGQCLTARVEERQGDVLIISLSNKGININEEMVAAGLLRVGKEWVPKRAMALVASMKKAEEGARKERLGMWRYGDVDEDDALEFGMVRQQKEQAAAKAAAAAPNAWGKK